MSIAFLVIPFIGPILGNSKIETIQFVIPIDTCGFPINELIK